MGRTSEFDSASKRVEFLLKKYPSLRSNDTKLWLSYLVMYHSLPASLKSKSPCTSFCTLVLDENVPCIATIRRSRQRLQQGGAYPKEAKIERRRTSLAHVNKQIGYHINERVRYLLDIYKPLRDDDKKLWISYLITFHNLEKINDCDDPYETLCSIILDGSSPIMETVRRCRQAFQQNGLYLGDKSSRSENSQSVNAEL